MATVFSTLRVMRPPYHFRHPIILGSKVSMRAPGGTATPKINQMSDLLEYVAVAAGLESDWAVAGDAIGNGHPTKSLKPKLGLAHRIHFAAGWNKRRRAPVSIGVARQARRPTSNGDPLEPVCWPALALASTCMRSEMRTLSVATAALAPAVATNLAPAPAQGPKTSGDNAWPGISQRVDSGSP